MTGQLPLPFSAAPRYAPEDFLAAPCNQKARDWLARPEHWTNLRLMLWGQPGCGKTHLAHLWAAQQGATLLAGAAIQDLTPAAGPLVIDGQEAAAEVPLFHLLNAAAAAGQPVLLTARLPPARQKIALPDLASRLRASHAVEIEPPDDAFLAALLTRLAADRQLQLTAQVRHFLLTRLPRTPAALHEALARLDHAALANGGKITRALAAVLLENQPPE